MKLKMLKEKRNRLLTDLEVMVSSLEADGEVRALNEDELAKFKSMEQEIKNIDATIEAVEEARSKTLTETERKEIKEAKDIDAEEMRSLDKFFRREILGAEERAMLSSTTSNQAIIPTTVSKTIMKKLEELCPVLDMAKRFSTKGALKLLKEDTYGEANVTGEMKDFANADVIFEYVELKSYKVTASIQASFELLQNSDINLTEYLTDVILRRLSRKINALCVAGDGKDKAQGLVNGKVTEDVKTKLGIEDFIKMQTAMNPQLLNGAVWIVNRKTFQLMASMLDANGRPYLTANVINDKIAYTLLGLQVIVDANLEDHEVGKKSIILANINEAYAINMLSEIVVRNLTEKGFTQGYEEIAGYVLFDGRIVNDDAIIVSNVVSATAKASK